MSVEVLQLRSIHCRVVLMLLLIMHVDTKVKPRTGGRRTVNPDTVTVLPLVVVDSDGIVVTPAAGTGLIDQHQVSQRRRESARRTSAKPPHKITEAIATAVIEWGQRNSDRPVTASARWSSRVTQSCGCSPVHRIQQLEQRGRYRPL